MVRSLGLARAAALTGTTPDASRIPPANAARSRSPQGASALYSRRVVSGSEEAFGAHPCPFPSRRSERVSAWANTCPTSSHQAVEREWFGQNRTGDELGGPIEVRRGWIAAHEDDPAQQPGPPPDNGEEEGVAGHLGQSEIEQHQIKPGLVQHQIRGVRIGHRDDLVVEVGERPLQGSAQRWLIIHDENAGAHDATWLSGDR